MTNDANTMVLCAKTLAETIVENGGEIYRAEEAVRRLQAASDSLLIDAFALPTGVFITVTCPDGKTRTSVCRFKSLGTDLNALDRANDIARKVSERIISPEDAINLLTNKEGKSPSPIAVSLLWSLAAACMSVLFGGSVFEFMASFLAAFLSRLVINFFVGEDMFNFIASLIGGALCALTGAILILIFPAHSLDIIIAASIFPLLPGATLVNAIRDTVHGDLISGVAKLGDVFVIVLALAAGTGTIIWLYSLVGGVL